MLEVLAAGPLTTVQDLGRPGLAALGVGASGAADRTSYRLGNRLVGNPEGAAALEVTFGGFAARARADLVLALTGAPCPARVGGRDVGPNGVVALGRGEELRLDRPTSGLRTYLAVRGGIDVAPVLGSRSTDVLSELGPPAVAAGDTLPVGAAPLAFPSVDVAPVAPPPAGEVELRILPGPRADWFDRGAYEVLGTAVWEVTSESNRVGMRLAGPQLARSTDRELPSEGLVRGALQVPPSGRPTLFLADHPVTGGYPVVAVVVDADADRAAQLRPGQRLRLRSARLPSPDGAP